MLRLNVVEAGSIMGTRVTVSFELLPIDEIRASYEVDAPGIYFLFLWNELVYVGQTIDFWARLGGHLRIGTEYDEHHLIPCPADDLDVLEALYVRHYKPPLNRGRGGPGRKAKRDARLAQRAADG